MNTTRTEILHLPNGSRDAYIAPNGEFSLDFVIPTRKTPVRRLLRVVGETDEFWRWRGESGNPYWLAQSIEDALYRNDAPQENFTMRLFGDNDEFERNAYLLLRQGLFPVGRPCEFSIQTRSENLAVAAGGEAVCELGIYLKKPGRAADDVYDMPDQTIRLNARQGTSGWQLLSQQFDMPADTACLLVRIGFRRASGLVAFGSPRLVFDHADSVIPPFDTPQTRRPEYNWLGENLDRRERPVFAMSLDGQPFFHGEKYNAIYRRPYFTVTMPDLAPGTHHLTIRLLADYPAAVGFMLLGLDVLEEDNDVFEIIAAPEFFPEATPCPVLIRTNAPDVALLGKTFAEPGDHVLVLPPMSAGVNRTVELTSGTCSRTVSIRAVIAGKPDGIRLSTSDAIFIPQTPEDFRQYLEWYTSNHVGNALRFRCCYRWSGSRIYDEATWKTIIPLLNDLGMDYVLQHDGRELPGKNGNPLERLAAGPHLLGRQAHENDGCFDYWYNGMWGVRTPSQPLLDIMARSIDYGGIQPHIRPPRSEDGRCWYFFNPRNARDVKEASDAFVANLAVSRGPSTRHSGPSTLFRYFFQAGFTYLEAEQMYGAEEVVLSALRGASRAYGHREFGAHLATQWSSTPHNTPEHADRYWLSLATCYLQDATQMNMEEGLWRMEKGFVDYDRYSENCLRHLAAHTRFRRFMETHRRRGELVTPVGIVQGRYDAWNGRGYNGYAWAREGEQWRFGPAENSFKLLKLFFPRSAVGAVYECPCSVEPHGWYSGTPYGAPDLFPVEGDFSRYEAVFFLGWHTFQPEDARKMLDYVRNGGLLLLTARHLSPALERYQALELPASTELDELLGSGWQMAQGTITRKVGKGQVIYFPRDVYPADCREEYTSAMRQLTKACVNRQLAKGWITGNDDVNFAVFDDAASGLRTIHLLNIRWWDRATASVTLHIDGHSAEIPVPFGEIRTVYVHTGQAVMFDEPLADIISMADGTAAFQSPEPVNLLVLRNGRWENQPFDAGVHSCRISQ